LIRIRSTNDEKQLEELLKVSEELLASIKEQEPWPLLPESPDENAVSDWLVSNSVMN